MQKVRWGILGVANIAVQKVIPAMQRGEWCEISAIASRDAAKARLAARELGIPKAYGSYDELLADPQIEAIYNPLPNHMHLDWSVRAAEAGKHVLCEKPLTLNAAEAREMVEVQMRTGVKMGEAFMVRTHPQWLRTRELVRSGRIGELRAAMGFFSYFNRDPQNVRNIPARRRRRAVRYRLLPDHHFAIHLRRRAAPRDGLAGARSGVADRPPDVRHAGLSLRASRLHLLDATGSLSAHAFLRHQGPH